MIVETRRSRRKDGTERIVRYECATTPDGRRRRTLIREKPTAEWTLRTLGSDTQPRASGKWSKKRRPGGVQPFIPKALLPLLESAGYRIAYGRLQRNWDAYLGIESTAVRFSLMDESAKASVGSPKRLCDACVKAYSMLKSRNRLSTPASYDQCLAEALAAG